MEDLWSYRHFSSADEFYEFASSVYGSDEREWSFICPSCETISTGKDFEDLGIDPQMASRECIGRHLPIEDDKPVRGCQWTSYGLFSGPWFIRYGQIDEGILPLADISMTDLNHGVTSS
jgi:hypothetical protein